MHFHLKCLFFWTLGCNLHIFVPPGAACPTERPHLLLLADFTNLASPKFQHIVPNSEAMCRGEGISHTLSTKTLAEISYGQQNLRTKKGSTASLSEWCMEQKDYPECTLKIENNFSNVAQPWGFSSALLCVGKTKVRSLFFHLSFRILFSFSAKLTN